MSLCYCFSDGTAAAGAGAAGAAAGAGGADSMGAGALVTAGASGGEAMALSDSILSLVMSLSIFNDALMSGKWLRIFVSLNRFSSLMNF